MRNAQDNPGCLFWFLPAPKPAKEPEAAEAPEVAAENPEQISEEKRSQYSDCYQPKYLFSKNEWHAHRKLKEIADRKGLIICPKVRMLDIVEPRKGEKDYKSLFYKIQAKHLDFVICDKGMRVLGVLELDDNSHEQQDRKDRDSFVDEVLESCGYKVIRTKYITETVLDGLECPDAGKD